MIICKAVSVASQSSTDIAWIHIQGIVVSPLHFCRFFTTCQKFKTHFQCYSYTIQMTTSSCVRRRYKIHLFREGVVIVSRTVNRTNYVVGFNCPCQPSCFAVTPIAGLLEGKEQVISPGSSCTEG